MAIIPGQQKGDFSFADPRREKKKKIYLFTAVLAVVCLAVYFGFLRSPTPEVNPGQIYSPAAAGENKKLEGLKNATLDPAVLNDQKFRSLVLPGQFPISVGEKGRINPFEPF